ILVALPLLVLLLTRTNQAYAREFDELKVEVSATLAPPKPRHEVIVLVENLDRATLGGLQYARQLNPLSITALHVAVDPDQAKRLAALWTKVRLPMCLEVVDCPDRNLIACTEQVVYERIRPDTEITVLLPRRGYIGLRKRLLHDQTGRELFRVLSQLGGVHVTLVPYRGAGPVASARARSPELGARTSDGERDARRRRGGDRLGRGRLCRQRAGRSRSCCGRGRVCGVADA